MEVIKITLQSLLNELTKSGALSHEQYRPESESRGGEQAERSRLVLIIIYINLDL